jgi:hypothetical protein
MGMHAFDELGRPCMRESGLCTIYGSWLSRHLHVRDARSIILAQALLFPAFSHPFCAELSMESDVPFRVSDLQVNAQL